MKRFYFSIFAVLLSSTAFAGTTEIICQRTGCQAVNPSDGGSNILCDMNVGPFTIDVDSDGQSGTTKLSYTWQMSPGHLSTDQMNGTYIVDSQGTMNFFTTSDACSENFRGYFPLNKPGLVVINEGCGVIDYATLNVTCNAVAKPNSQE